jgi:uncharacterized protein
MTQELRLFGRNEPQTKVYSDLDLGFVSHPVTGKLVRKTNRDAVKQSVKSLIMTNFYERPFKPDLGCGIRNLLFENYHPAIIEEMKSAIAGVIRNYEPRADIFEIDVDGRPDQNSVSITIVFFVLNDSSPVTLNVLLERIR